MDYPKIETLYVRDPKSFKVYPGQFKNRTYTIPNRWHFTEKIDGQNIGVIYTPFRIPTNEAEEVVYPGVRFVGKSEQAQIHTQLVARLQDLFPVEKFEKAFPNGGNAPTIQLFGEGYGPGIQKGGGDYIDHKDFILFDVLVDGHWWLNWEGVRDVATKLGIPTVPEIGLMTLEEATEFARAGFATRVPTAKLLPTGALRQAEGIVGRTEEPLFDKKGHRLIVKLKFNDFGPVQSFEPIPLDTPEGAAAFKKALGIRA